MSVKPPTHPHLRDEALSSMTMPGFTNLREEPCTAIPVQNQHDIYTSLNAQVRNTNEKRAHWSIAWSDLMMTMFILFLCLFIYQATHKDLLMSDEIQILAGETVAAQDPVESPISPPIITIGTKVPLITAGTIPKAVPVKVPGYEQKEEPVQSLPPVDVEKTIAELEQEFKRKENVAAPFIPNKNDGEVSFVAMKSNMEQVKRHMPQIITGPTPEEIQLEPHIQAQPSMAVLESQPDMRNRENNQQVLALNAGTEQVNPVEEILQPHPLSIEPVPPENLPLSPQDQIALEKLNLKEIASIDLLPDRAVRIVLTGDLLFETGDVALSREAIYSLEKIASVIAKSPYQVNIEGHTDNVPIRSGKYANNWELSFARANAVATFLIQDMAMDPQQFVISGYSSYRPVVPNNSATNRATNRRVEIVISQKPFLVQQENHSNTIGEKTAS